MQKFDQVWPQPFVVAAQQHTVLAPSRLLPHRKPKLLKILKNRIKPPKVTPESFAKSLPD